MPSMIALIDSNFGDMLAYYRMFSCDSTWVGQIEIQPRDVNPVAMTSFEALLAAIANQVQRGNKRLLIGTHGWPDALPYPIVVGTDVSADVNFFNSARSALEGDDDARNDLLNWESTRTKRKVFQNSARLDKLLGLIDTVRRARIDHLEFRGCNIAKGGCLEAIHLCLNSRYSVAPSVDFFSGVLHPLDRANTTTQLLQYISTLAPSRRVFSRTECLLPFSSAANDDDPGFAIDWVRVSEHPTRYRGRVFAASLQAVEGWCKTMLENSFFYPFGQRPAGGGFQRRGVVPIIGMWTPTGGKPFLFPGDSFDYLNVLGTQISP